MFARMGNERGTDQLGMFGLGFKSVLVVSDSPEFFGRAGSFRFDRAESARRVREVVPDAEECPVLRLPEPIDPNQCSDQDGVLRELMGWATNIVRLPLKSGAHKDLLKQMRKLFHLLRGFGRSGRGIQGGSPDRSAHSFRSPRRGA